MKNVCVLGGSFNCIHKGHIEILKAALEKLKLDEGYLLISNVTRWKDRLVNKNYRLKLVKEVCKHEGFKILDYELSLKGVNYTYNTMLHYKNLNPDTNYYFLIGADQLNQIDKWYEIVKLSKLVTFVVVGRAGYELKMENVEKYGCILLDYEGPLNSSSAFQKTLDLGLLPTYLHPFIINEPFYYKKKLRSQMSYKRYLHSLQVAKLAKQIAISNNYDPSKAYLAGLLHDAAKDIDREKEISIMKKYYPEHLGEGRVMYHQYVGEYILKNEYLIHDEEILEAVKYHTSGKKNMTTLAKIVYAADKIEPTRGYDSSSLINQMLEDVNKGFEATLKDNYNFLVKKGVDVLKVENTKECFIYYKVIAK